MLQVDTDKLERLGRMIDGAYGVAQMLELDLADVKEDTITTHAATGLVESITAIRALCRDIIDETFTNARKAAQEAGEDA